MRRAALVLVGLLAAAHVVANGVWLDADEGVQFTDAAYHYGQVVELSQAWFADAQALDDQQRYGEAWYVVAALMTAITGAEAGRLLLGLSLLLWPALLFAAFRLGEELAPPERSVEAGLLAAAMASVIPGLFNYTRVLVLDAPLAAAVAWSTVGCLAVLRAEDAGRPSRRAWLLAIGAALVGLAVKMNAAAFLLGPLLVAARPSIARRWSADRRTVLRSLGGAVAAGVVLSLWMVLSHRADALLLTARDATWPGKALDYLQAGTLSAWPGDWARAAWGQSWEVAYFTTLQTVSPPLLLACLAAALWFFARRRGCEDPLAHAQRDLVFWAWIVPALGVVLVLRGLYDERYILPALPLAAGVLGGMVGEIPRRAPRWLLAGALVVGGAVNFLWISFDVLPTTRPLACLTVPGWTQTDRVGRDLWLCGGYPDYRFMDRPSEPTWGDWPLGELQSALYPLRDLRRRPLKAVFLDRLYELFYRVHQKDLIRRDLFDPDSLLLITHCDDDAWMASMFGSRDAAEALIADADVVVMRYGSPGEHDPAVRGRRCTVFWPQADRFDEAGSLPLHDGTEIRWYVRR